MNEKKIKNPKLYKLLDIKYSYKNSLQDIMNFVKHLKPIIEKEDKQDFENYIKAISSAFKKAGLELPNESENIEPTEEQKKLIYKNLELPEAKSPNKNGHLWKSNFVLLISSFEYLISDIITFYYKNYPQNELDNKFEVNLKNLKNFETIDDFIDDIISKKVEGLLYKSNEDQLKFLESTIKLDLSEKYINWELINEAVLRRHLIVHNNSKINKRYLNEANLEYSKDVKEISEGKKVFIGAEYFNIIYEELYLAGQLLIQNSWRKWLKEFEEVANAELIDLTYYGNIEKLYKMSEKIGLYGKDISTINNDFLFRINVNYCLSLKNQGKSKELKQEIEKIDISNLSPIYILAFHALQDNCVDALKYVRHAKSVDKLEFDSVMEWPIFEGLRKNEVFVEKVHKIYRKKL
jgi:hypothetical protein